MLLEALLEDGGLVLGQPELLARPAAGVLVVAADAGSRGVVALLLRSATARRWRATLPAEAGQRAVGRRRAGVLVLAAASPPALPGWRPVHVDPPQERHLVVVARRRLLPL